MTDLSIHTWHVVISGFMQEFGDVNGMVRLWRNIDREVANGRVATVVRRWNSTWDDLAELIYRLSPARFDPALPEPVVKVYSYSWGCGYGFVTLAKELRKRGIRIQVAVLSDPVYRSRLISLRFLAMLPSMRIPWLRINIPRIVVPNTDKVYAFYQRQNKPCGHHLVPADNTTEIVSYTQLDAIHQYMDDQPAFHAKALEVAKSAPFYKAA